MLGAFSSARFTQHFLRFLMTPERYAQIGELYHAALERGPLERSAFLVAASAGDDALRGEVESLLAAHEQAASFIEQPAPEMAAQVFVEEQMPPPLQVGQQLGAYQLQELLGRGGMGEVYLAFDTRLQRKVAIKLLPAAFTHDAERVRRFTQEARAASALNQPNIITIHEIGVSQQTHFLVTEFVEGQTLRTWLRNNESSLHEKLDIVLQITTALVAAHAAGIIHRDIKPENVMVRPDGLVKVLDFGLAKLLAKDEGGGTKGEKNNLPRSSFSPHPSTMPGIVMGTPRYMSPEQARGEKVDARSDIFSLGVMLYEMVASRAPFAGETPSEVIAAILRDDPMPLAEDIPERLREIIAKALRKDCAGRYQSATELLADLNQCKQAMLTVGGTIGQPASERTAPHEMTPLPRTWMRRFVLLVLVGLLLIIAATAAWVYFKRTPTLTNKDTILLADFENQTGEAIFDKMLKQGVAIQLQQTPFLHLFPEAQMRHELTLMKRQVNERVTAEIAREICERQNLKAFIAGSITPLGSRYVLTLEALNGQSGETLAHEQVEAEGKEQVLKALSQAATQLREKLGESLSSIQRFDRPLQEGTTAKPEAFKAFSQGAEIASTGRIAESISFYQRAVELDPEFAIAYTQLAIMYGLTDQPALAAENAKKAYALQDRASEIEKFRIVQTYHRLVTGDLNKTIESLRLYRRTYPREHTGPNDLALCYNLMGEYEAALPELREGLRINPQFAALYRNLAWALLSLNRFSEAKDTIAQARQRGLDHRDFYVYLYQLAFLNGDAAGMQQQLDAVRGKPFENVAFDWQTGAAAAAGQWRKAQELSRRATSQLEHGATTEVAARYLTEQALRGAVLGDYRQAKLDAAQGLQLARSRSSLPRVALALALCNELKQAQMLVDELHKLSPEDTIINAVWLPAIRAAIELQRGAATQTIEQLQPATRYEAAAEFWPPYLRGQAYLKLGKGTEAAAEFQKILDHRGYAPLSPLYPLAYLGLARATQSRKAYDDFLAWWKAADADLPLLLAARKEAEQR